jgi:hypothetical protein
VALLFAPPVKAQTVDSLPIPISLNFMTNIPTVTNFASATIGLETGVATQSGSTANYIKGDVYFKTNFMASVEIQNAPVSTVLESASVYFGYRKVYSNAELYAQLGGRRTITVTPSWQGGLLIGASWYPITGGKVAITASSAFWSSASGAFKSAPSWELRAGVKMLF